MKLYTWNVNGIRAVSKKGFWEFVATHQPDILAVQEIKADQDAFEKWWQDTEQGFESDLMTEFNYGVVWNACSIKKGYSGTAIFYRKDKFPNIKSYNLGISKFDDEGRTTVLELEIPSKTNDQTQKKIQNLAIINCYYPQGGRPERIPFKLEFYQEVINLVNRLKAEGKTVILCGDMNTTVADIDLARPKQNRKTTGCLPEEREILNSLFETGSTDVFRFLYPDLADKYTYWDQITRARDRNVGWRIDYFLVDNNILNRVIGCEHHDQAFGSDHCPVSVEIEI